MRAGMNAAATFAVQGSGPGAAPLHAFEDSLVLESAWSHYQPHFSAATVKQEPADHDANNDSGISPGRGTGSSSGSDGPSPDRAHPRSSSNPLPSYTSAPNTSTVYQTPGRPESSPAPGYHPNPSLRVSLSVAPNSPNQFPAAVGPDSPSQFPSPALLTQPNSPGQFPSAIQPNSPKSQSSPVVPQAQLNCPVVTSQPSAQSPSSSCSVTSDGDQSNQHGQYYHENKSQSYQEAEDPLRRLQMALERTEMMGAMKSEKEGTNLQCALCEFSTTSRSELHTHEAAHYEPKGEGLSPDEDTDPDEPGVRVPRVNSQGKVKTFRCKQCDFVALTKLDFWEHSRGHIKAEKLLTCPKCPFVTEYKHHLEYHLRNHFGSKPFKCGKCSYSCVNKSMLNSHLKSHSNIYQYRCANCNYATKYCHSLKLHLRKYGHKPAMVLNPDGSPNPLPIIDVYGTRRGPKLRHKLDDVEAQNTNLPPLPQQEQQQQQQQQQQQAPQQPQQFPMFQPAFNILTAPRPNGLPLPFPYGPLLNGAFPATNSSIPAFPYSNHIRYEETPNEGTDTNVEHPLLAPQLVHVNNNNNTTDQDGMKDYLARIISSRQIQIPRLPEYNGQYFPEEVKTPTNPLDLSKPFTSDTIQPTPNNNNNSGTKNRRKGKAYKLERIAMKLQHQPDSEDECQIVSPIKMAKYEEKPKSPEPVESETQPDPPVVESIATTKSLQEDIISTPKVTEEATQQKVHKPENVSAAKLNSESYNCTYCDITFKDIVMYTMHMGYHGYQDPFTCNMCGQQTADRVAFFIHIARSSHC